MRIPARKAARILSLIPPTGRTLPRSVISPVIATSLSTGIFVTAEKSETAMVMPGGRPVLGDRALRHVDVDVELLVEVGVGVVHLGAAADVGDGRAGRLLHDVAERAGQRQVALALEEARLGHEDLAAGLGPGQPGRDADLRDLALAAVAEAGLAEEVA